MAGSFATLILLQAQPVTPLEKLALLAVLAVLLVAFARTTLRKRERRRTPRGLDPDISPLRYYRAHPHGQHIRTDSDPPARPAADPQRFAPPVARAAVPDLPAAKPAPPSRPAPKPSPPVPAAEKPITAAPSAARSAAPRKTTRQPAGSPALSVTRAAPRAEIASLDDDAVADGTLQLLPGRLEVISGLGHREEIRFVKVGSHEPAITFGRSSGDPHLHVRLDSPTVSRVHARMRRTAGAWLLANLSNTNPVVVNGQPMSNGHEHRLQDGDRIEMGEVVLQFKAG